MIVIQTVILMKRRNESNFVILRFEEKYESFISENKQAFLGDDLI